MKVVALISGGKDSLYSILHCIAQEHDIVALANLHPPQEGQRTTDSSGKNAVNEDEHADEEIDSHMYQTVGHAVIPLYEQALGLPLFCEPIQGDAVYKGQDYALHTQDDETEVKHDETESMTTLLKKVKAAIPDIEAVSTGAILSTYQRTRVESVALRLGLVPLSYLWQYPYLPSPGHSTLLDDMAAAGADARIIKVASGGLDQTHLWKNVADHDTIAMLERDMGRYGELEVGSVLGEGGEYETLAIDGPAPLWKKKIATDVDDDCLVTESGGVGRVLLKKPRLVDEDHTNVVEPRIPDMLDTEWQAVLDYYAADMAENKLVLQTPEYEGLSNPSVLFLPQQEHVYETSKHVHILNLTAEPGCEVSVQADGIRSKLISFLNAKAITPDDLSSVTILLRSMQDFAPMNASYKRLFSQPNPPARITVTCGDLLPAGASIMVSATAPKIPRSSRRGLHVQSQSYWAPANIGPYSQAISTPFNSDDDEAKQSRLVSIAGQIPLVPAKMKMVDEPFTMHAVLAAQHLWRIARAMQVKWWVNGVAFITASSASEAQERAATAIRIWSYRNACPGQDVDDEEENADLDIGDLHLQQPWNRSVASKSKLMLEPLPDWRRNKIRFRGKVTIQPLCFVAQVDDLPRGACIEWTALGLAPGNDVNEVVTDGNAHRCHSEDSASGTYWTMLASHTQQDMEQIFADIEQGKSQYGEIDLLEAYVKMPTSQNMIDRLMGHRAQMTPCRGLWSEEGPLNMLLRCRWLHEYPRRNKDK